ncbi:MAG: hypothetical protein DRI37_08210 [Chloroflexi bacterium]|nr:MAG: hypothetical protein DRI37_08210 [Chloroflexota bacterium]
MTHFYPSFQTLELADQILDTIGQRVTGYQGRIGVAWYWRLSGGILVTVALDYTVTEQRWNVLRAKAASPSVGLFNAADFPFVAYGTLSTSPPFIHDLDGEAEWSNRLYFQMGHLIEDATRWLEMLQAALIAPQILPPASFPELNPLERALVAYARDELNGYFRLSKLAPAFKERISRRGLSRLAQRWEDVGLLTERPHRVTIALRVLVNQEEGK